MLCLPMGPVVDLMPTTGTVGSYDDLFPGFLNGREQFKSPYLHAYPVMFLLISEGTRHATTSGCDYGDLIIAGQIENVKGNFLIGYGFLMAMGMDLHGFGLLGKLIGSQ